MFLENKSHKIKATAFGLQVLVTTSFSPIYAGRTLKLTFWIKLFYTNLIN